jgi:UDP-N-acetylmuramoyl-L-alanyl-D-glutamate--2,6-diaminopimelate ligase
MRNIKELLNEVGIQWNGNNQDVHSITSDSRQATAGVLFVAIPGTQIDAHQFIPQVIAQGCTAILAQEGHYSENENIVFTANTQHILGALAAAFYHHPSNKLNVVGVTGTNGKTTVATVLFQAFESMGYPCGLISTVENKIGHRVIPSTHTTPDPIQLQKLFADMVEAGVSHVFMEVSSHAIHQNRIGGIDFKIAIFTNLTHDHLDYHGTFANYRDAKKMWFDQLPSHTVAIINKDDKNGRVMVQNTAAKIQYYSLKGMAEFKGKLHSLGLEGMELEINHQIAFFRLTGAFNAYNLLAVYATGICLGLEKTEWLQTLSATPAARGRMETIVSENDRLIGIVDYAHTPDALENVLSTIVHMKRNGQNIHCLVGCGGDRDTAKRPVMAQIAAQHADRVILTSDNPRSEEPNDILAQMWAGVPTHVQKKVIRLADRKEAIRLAVSTAAKGDILLVAGKGHETYQEIKGVKYPFDDLNELKSAFQEMNR